MHAVVLSDIHIGWEGSNTEDFVDFIESELPSIDPDVLIVNGDIFEMWRRGLVSVIVEYRHILDALEKVTERGIDLVLIAGNHDWRLVKLNDSGDVVSPKPFQFKEEYTFTSGDRDFRVLHGHQGDGVNGNDAQNEALCATSDERADDISDAYAGVLSKSPLTFTSRIAPLGLNRLNLGALENLSDPDALSKDNNVDRSKRITERLEKMYDDYILFGHTHTPEIREQSANSGSWTGDTNNYLEIKDGMVELKEYK